VPVTASVDAAERRRAAHLARPRVRGGLVGLGAGARRRRPRPVLPFGLVAVLLVVVRGGDDHGPAGGGDGPGDAVPDRDARRQLTRWQPEGRLALEAAAVGAEQQHAAGAALPRPDGRLQHHGEQPRQVVGGGEGLAEAGGRPRQLADLAGGADRRRRAGEVAPGDRVRLLHQLAQRLGDEAGEQRAQQRRHRAEGERQQGQQDR
jgi:hypothetical protein